jgi:hypothetical protein
MEARDIGQRDRCISLGGFQCMNAPGHKTVDEPDSPQWEATQRPGVSRGWQGQIRGHLPVLRTSGSLSSSLVEATANVSVLETLKRAAYTRLDPSRVLL